MKKIRIGFIGCGYVSEFHLKHLKDRPDVELVGFSGGKNFDKVKNVAEKYSGIPYTDHKKMLSEAKPDAVYVLVPPFAHGEIEKDCAERGGIHMMIEKPITTSLDTAKKIFSYIKANNIICSVAYHWRYSYATNQAKELLKDKNVGMVEGHWCGWFPEGSDVWCRQDKSGGQIIEQTTHLFDLARYFFGEVERVSGEGDLRLLNRKFPKVNVKDCSAVTLRFKNGIIGVMISRCCQKTGEINLKIIAEDLVLTHFNRKLEVWRDGNQSIMQDPTIPEGECCSGFKEENDVFIEAVKSRNPSSIRSTYQDAIKTLELTLVAEEAITKHKIVRL